ncbi:MAG: LysR family transcriptional regulator [Oscillospiraceae bacterium]|nr:LysR family transcriptional regulator [Oscillospiraceae bacterium]
MKQFITIEKNKSMRKASEELFLSQSALSHNLKKLEDELGCQLFDRTRQQLTLNTYGEIMLRHSQHIIEELKEAKQEITKEKIRQAQKLRIGVYAYAFGSFVMPNLANAIEENVFECHICDSPHLTQGLLDGTLDIIFTDLPVEGEGFVATRLFKEQIMVSLPFSSEYASRQSLFLSDLRKLNLYLVSDASGYTPWFERVLLEAGMEAPLKNGIPFKEYLYTKDSIEQCHLTSSFIERFLPAAVRRVLLPLSEEIGTRSIYMIYRKQEKNRLTALLAYIEKYQDHLFTGSAFLPYFLFPTEQNNLHFCNETE